MAAEKQITPEKQLLNLIEKPVSAGSLHTAAIKYHGLSFFSLGALRGRIAFLKNKLKSFNPNELRELDIRVVNRMLNLLIFILGFYFIANFTSSAMRLNQPLELEPKIEKNASTGTAALPSLLKATSYYLDKIRERDIFNMGARKAADTAKGPSQKLLAATENLKLVGIAWSLDPDVMIEDTVNQRTMFLKKGQMINNEVKVEAVFKDKVILSYQGEEVELK
jgi:hypothetical protein